MPRLPRGRRGRPDDGRRGGRHGGTGPEPTGPRDPVFGYFSESQGARFRSLVRQTFAEAGVEVVAERDYLVADDGRQFGLSNLAAVCLDVLEEGGEKAWPAAVRRHVHTILRATAEDVALTDLDRDEVLGRTYLRVIGRSAVPPEALNWYRYARPLAGDLLELLALDSPDSVRMLRDTDVEPFGSDDLRAAGLENLIKEPYDSYQTLTGQDGAELQLVLGQSVYTASKLLVLPDVLDRTLGSRDLPHGVFVAVPFWHQLAFVPIRDLSAVASLQLLVAFAARGFDEGVGAISPFVYWWRNGRLTQVSYPGERGELVVQPDGELVELLESLPPAPG
jgi:hypothetical protein